jgi:uncharacterized peroxidase-related enzyme
MSDSRVATVRPIDEAEATGRVAEIFNDIKATKKIDFVPLFWRVLATHPGHLDLIWSRLKAIMHPESLGQTSRLDPLTRELIALAVSSTNGCPYCINSHTVAAQKLGMDTEMLGEVMSIVGLFNTTNTIAEGYQIVPDVKPALD